MDSEQYWKNRALRVKNQALTAAEDYEKGAHKRFTPVQKDIEEQIKKWTERYATASGMTIEDAQASLTPAEMKGWKQSLAEWEKMAVSPEYKEKYKALMDAEYAKSKINRLEVLKSQVQHTMAQYASPEADKMQNMLTATYANTYYRSVHNIQNQKMQISGDFAKFNEDQLQAAVGQRWAGSDFSSRIWGNMVEKWPEQLNKTIFKGAAMGLTADEMIKEARLTFKGATEYNLHRLITTEAGHVAESATLKAYQESGVERYEYMATLESHTCEICRALDGKVYEVKKQIAGENYPLIHPSCRCTTGPWIPEVQTMNNERWSRNPETGKVEMVNNVSFGEWAKQVGLENGPLKPGTKLKTIYSKAAKTAVTLADAITKLPTVKPTEPELVTVGDDGVYNINYAYGAVGKDGSLDIVKMGSYKTEKAAIKNTLSIIETGKIQIENWSEPNTPVYNPTKAELMKKSLEQFEGQANAVFGDKLDKAKAAAKKKALAEKAAAKTAIAEKSIKELSINAPGSAKWYTFNDDGTFVVTSYTGKKQTFKTQQAAINKLAKNSEKFKEHAFLIEKQYPEKAEQVMDYADHLDELIKKLKAAPAPKATKSSPAKKPAAKGNSKYQTTGQGIVEVDADDWKGIPHRVHDGTRQIRVKNSKLSNFEIEPSLQVSAREVDTSGKLGSWYKDTNGAHKTLSTDWTEADITKTEATALFWYTAGSSYINEPMRGQTYYGPNSRDAKRDIANIRKAISKTETKHNITVVRKDDFGAAALLNNGEFKDGAFYSTSSSPNMSWSGIPIIIEVPKGKGRGTYLHAPNGDRSGLGSGGVNSRYSTEYEYLLSDKATLILKAVNYDRSGDIVSIRAEAKFDD